MDAIKADPVLSETVVKAVQRTAEEDAAVSAAAGGGAPAAAEDPSADPFDTVIAGPWMNRWEIVHHNKHVDRFLANQAKGVGSDWHAHTKGGAFG
jgi:hypothetical protein